MRVPVSWLTEHLETDETFTAEQLADAFVRVGIEVEEVTPLGQVTGPVVVGRVAEIEELGEFKKPIRYCMVEVAEADDHADQVAAGSTEPRVRGVVCGATNFVEGDLVVVALPGAVLPGGFAISARQTYGHTSDGMICSPRELGLGDEHGGILVLPSGEAGAGDDAVELLGLDESVIELSITPDRGYAFSVRGLARELACALDLQYRDPAAIDVPAAEGHAFPVEIEDPD
ncbi:MAG: phenylalanine--tRNA ligase subunit beta, partial [Actinophytocola sp.]|nr:phenylalanine--tRNA ligase subunit beta [Actinophytocola sp.]